ncbi:MAG: ribulose-phosphate 3-epimerase [Spirochaetales bacterium]|nr:ribulose-phosphate 3-epimerase [Spirochaetales bacterium]
MQQKPVLIAPSLLAADFGDMRSALTLIEKAKGDWVHFDVMDGNFVPNITFGTKMIADLRPLSKLPFDVHLMVRRPERHVKRFVMAGADHITIHIEAAVHVHRLLSYLKDKKVKTGITLVPSTPISRLMEILHMVDIVLVMTVNPGFSGQLMIDECLKKVRQLKEIKKKMGYNFYIEVDGGINRSTYKHVVDAGGEVLVMGSSFFSTEDPLSEIAYIKGGK